MKLKRWHIVGAIVTLVLGTLLHFTFDWSGGNLFVGLFSAVNESVWEHLKLLAVPILLFAIIEYFAYGRAYDNFIPAKLLSVLAGMLTIVVFFYTYTGIIGEDFLAADISLFVLGTLVAWFVSYKLLKSGRLSSQNARIYGLLGLFVLVVVFIIFTFAPPQLPPFQDPVSGTYGMI
jgi:hypothetical protein